MAQLPKDLQKLIKEEAAARESRWPSMDRDTLEALTDYLQTLISITDELQVSGCDGTLNKSALWLLARERDVAFDLRWLEARGGHCDCEVIMNVSMDK